jgi:hypothetical protein
MKNPFKRKKKELTEDEIIEREINEELKESDKPINPFNFKEIFELLKNKTDEDIEYDSLLTEEEKEIEEKDKKDLKRLLIISASSLLGVVIVFAIISCIFVETSKDDLYKITAPAIKAYYKNKYNKTLNIASIEKLTDESDEYNGQVLVTTKDGNYILYTDNEEYADDIDTSIKTQVEDSLNESLMQLGILESNINLSYQDYYNEYNKKISYINVIPDKSYEELISSNKLTIEYTGIITNDEDISLVQNVLSNYSSDSIIYLIKQENGLPTKLIVISKNTYYIINITGSKEVDDGIFTYEFDKNYNKINKITFNKYADSTVEDYDKYTLKNIFSIEIDTDYSYQNDIRGTYYLVKFSNSNIITNNLIEVDYNNDTSTYEELDISQYKNYVLISFGGYTYLVANSDLTLGYLSENKSFICNLGLC